MRGAPPVRRLTDLLAVTALVAGTVATARFGGDTLGAVLGGCFLLVGPGYALVAALFPSVGDEGLPVVDRVVFAVATSVALAIVVGVGLSVSPWRLTAETTVVTLASVTLGGLLVAVTRRSGSSAGDEHDTRSPLLGRGRGSTLLVGVVLFGVLSAGWIGFLGLGGAGTGAAGFTEFSLLTNDGGTYVASGYPSAFVVNDSRPVYLGIDNHEGRRRTYTVGVVVQRPNASDPTVVESATRIDRLTTTVGGGETVRQRHDLAIPVTGELRIVYRLYRGDPSNLDRARPIERLHLWVTVSEANG